MAFFEIRVLFLPAGTIASTERKNLSLRSRILRCYLDMVESAAALLAPSSLSLRPVPPPSLARMVNIENKLSELGIELPPAPKAAANYQPCQRSGDLLFLSGHLPLNNDGTLQTGKISSQTVDKGYQAARQVALNLIATLQAELGDLDRVEQVVKLFGIVQSTDDFHEQHKVMNGCSDVFVEVFGKERGFHARSAIGTNALPLDISVEVEAIVRVK